MTKIRSRLTSVAAAIMTQPRTHRTSRNPAAAQGAIPHFVGRRDASVASVCSSSIDADGTTGWSECVAGEQPNYSSETIDTAWLAIREWLAPRVLGRAFDASATTCSRVLDANVRGHNMAKAAIEMGMLGRRRATARACRSQRTARRNARSRRDGNLDRHSGEPRRARRSARAPRTSRAIARSR